MSDDTPTKPVVTRFAPSPTGSLHVGGARTALYAWAFARKHHGKFILRIEDTDQTRSTEASTRGILRDMQWLGLNWDEGPDPNASDPYSAATQIGPNAPYFQSQRLDKYQAIIQKLIAAGRAYEDQGAVRFRMDRDIAFDDAVYGHITHKAADLEDFVIQKSDGFPTFHLAVIADDIAMGVTHVIRGQEHLSNTPKHAALYGALGAERPVWAHTPSIMNPDGSKMSKRDKAKVARAAAKVHIQELGSAEPWFQELIQEHKYQRNLTSAPSAPITEQDLADFIDKKNDRPDITTLIAYVLELQLPEIEVSDFCNSGYLPSPLLNYLALLGWNPGNDVERFDLDFMIQSFTLDRINKSNSKFDRDKLKNFNQQHIASLSIEEFRAKLWELRPGFYEAKFGSTDDHRFQRFTAAYQPRSQTLRDPETLGSFFFKHSRELTYDDKAVKKNLTNNDGEGLAVLADLETRLKQIEPWSGQVVHDLIKTMAEEKGVGMGKIAQPLRVAISGNTVTPPIDETLDILGKDATISLIQTCRIKFMGVTS